MDTPIAVLFALSLFMLALVLFMVGLTVFSSSRQGKAPGAARRYRGLVACALGVIFLIALCLGIREFVAGMGYPWLTIALGAAGMVFAVVLLVRSRGKLAETEDFLANPRYCGRCGYDLTGNVSGACPECGWTLPAGVPVPSTHAPATGPEWTAFWKQWRIRHLDDWRTHLKAKLASAVTRTVLFTFLCLNAILLASQLSSLRDRLLDPPAIFIAIVLLVLLLGALISWIQVIRLSSYGLRKRTTNG